MNWKISKDKSISVPHIKYVTDWNSSSGSSGEVAVRQFLYKNLSYYTWIEQFRIPKTLLRVDFLCPALKLAIEFDGESHYKFNKFHHKGSRFNFLASLKRDDKKEQALELNDITLIRIRESDLPLTLDFFKENGVVI